MLNKWGFVWPVLFKNRFNTALCDLSRSLNSRARCVFMLYYSGVFHVLKLLDDCCFLASLNDLWVLRIIDWNSICSLNPFSTSRFAPFPYSTSPVRRPVLWVGGASSVSSRRFGVFLHAHSRWGWPLTQPLLAVFFFFLFWFQWPFQFPEIFQVFFMFLWPIVFLRKEKVFLQIYLEHPKKQPTGFTPTSKPLKQHTCTLLSNNSLVWWTTQPDYCIQRVHGVPTTTWFSTLSHLPTLRFCAKKSLKIMPTMGPVPPTFRLHTAKRACDNI